MRKLLVLDLDETLIHAVETPLDRAADFEVPPYHIYKRPGVDHFLKSIADIYRLSVWTSSSPDYARDVCDALFDALPLEFVWASDRCTLTRDRELDRWIMAKRLSKLRRHGYSLEDVVVIDDSPEKHTQNYGNLVVVHPFEGSPSDNELALLLPYLHDLASAPNIRSVEKRGWHQGLMHRAVPITSCPKY